MCGCGRVLIIVSKEYELRDPSCDVPSISTNIQDGGQLNISNQNISRNKADIEILGIVWSLFQMRQYNFLLLFPFKL